MITKISILILALGATLLPAAEISLAPEKLSPAIQDRQNFQTPDRIQLGGWVGARIAANEGNRLVKLDPERLLEGYRHRSPSRNADA